ncbi:MAG: M56 family metallopeptidase [Eubacteriales bacterium]
MEYRIFILFFILVLLSFVFAAFSFVVLKIRDKYSVKLSPLMWAVFFFTVSVPLIFSTHFVGLKLYTNYTGGVRIEVFRSEDSEPKNEVYVPKNIRDAAYTVCTVYISARIVKLSAEVYMGMAGYFNTLHFLTKYSKMCRDEKVLAIFESARKKSGLHRRINLRVMKSNVRISPCTCGINFPTVFIGEDYLNDYSELQLELVFLHELIHIKRGDSLIKILALLSSSFQLSGFNSKIKSALNEDAEYLCDKKLIKIMGENVIKDYIGVIIDVAERNVKSDFQPETISPISQSAGFILSRYNNMINEENQNPPKLLSIVSCTSAILISAVMFSFITVFNADNLGVDIANPALENALCDYFELRETSMLSEEHLSQIYSIEFYVYDGINTEGETENKKYAICYSLNESEIYESDSELTEYDNIFQFSESKTVDTRDIALFHDLRTLIFSNGLSTDDAEIYTNTSYAVISR